MDKTVSKTEFPGIRETLKAENKTIALCHGVFDLVHPGHIIHLEQAKSMADVLVVSITAAKYVRKGPDRPYFDDGTRMNVLSALACVDYVMLSESDTADDILEVVKPDLYVKGKEYAEPEEDLTGKIAEEKLLVEKYGGKLVFTSGKVFSSTKLINTVMGGLSDEVRGFMETFHQKHTMAEIMEYSEIIKHLKILVVGDVIIDQYTYCAIQGTMSKDIGYSARASHTEEYLGGAAAVARHLASFCGNVTLLSVTGNEERLRIRLLDELSDRMRLNLLCSSVFPTIVKHRYLSRNTKREEYRKIFAVNNIPEKNQYEENVCGEFHRRLEECVKDYDAVFVCDFGHGLIDEETISLLEGQSKKMMLNCQTNSSNYGFNVITKYRRADAFSLDQKELKLAFPEHAQDEKQGLKKLADYLGGSGWLTRGALGAYGISGGEIQECPAFTLNVKDTIGAGDAFFAIACCYMAAGAPVDLCTFLGNIAGALGANIVGNREAVEKVNVLKYADTLMKV